MYFLAKSVFKLGGFFIAFTAQHPNLDEDFGWFYWINIVIAEEFLIGLQGTVYATCITRGRPKAPLIHKPPSNSARIY